MAIEAGMANTVMCVHARKRATPMRHSAARFVMATNSGRNLGAISRPSPITPSPRSARCTTSALPAKISPMSRRCSGYQCRTSRDFPKRPVAILGVGQHHPHFSLMDAPNLTNLGGKKSSKLAYQMAGLTPGK
jgi:hypothetical protein